VSIGNFSGAHVSDAGGGGGGGTSDHATLSNLDYASAAHTGFQAALTTGNLTATSPIVLDQTRQVIGGAAVISLIAAYQPRERLAAARTYYVRTDGNDSNTGLVDSAVGAFLTIQHAIDIYQSLDCNGFNVTITIGTGTYPEALYITGRIGTGNLYLVGDETTPANVVIAASGGTTVTGSAVRIDGHPAGSYVYVRGFKLTSDTGAGIYITNGSTCYFRNLDFGICAAEHLYSQGNLQCEGNYTISGGSLYHFIAYYGGLLQLGSVTVTITGTPNFASAFAFSMYSSTLRTTTPTWSGSATGKRYIAQVNGVIHTGQATTWLPGNVDGTVATGGQYI
jgi:hypothetical protein